MPEKGRDLCNRMVCQAPLNPPRWWNTSTRAYYCDECKHKIEPWGPDYLFEDHATPTPSPELENDD